MVRVLKLGLQRLQGTALVEQLIRVAIQAWKRLLGVEVVVGLLRCFV